MVDLSGKCVVVTGAGSGVGLATVEASLAQGANVMGLDLNPIPVEHTEFSAHIVDVSDTDSWADFALKLGSTKIDHLHLNAGIQSAPPSAPLPEYQFGNLQLDRYRKMMGVNVDGVVLGLHHLLPTLNSGGSIVVTCSLAGITPYDVDPLYSMSKHAVTGLVRSLRRELLAKDIRINAICPGGIDTNIIPHEQRTNAADFMTGADLAEEVLRLFETPESGETWAKVTAAKPAWIVHAPGQKNKQAKN